MGRLVVNYTALKRLFCAIKCFQQETGEFTVQMQDVLETHQSIMKCKLSLEDDNEAISKLCSAYNNKFLSYCNAVDFADVLQRVKTCFIVDSDAKDNFQTSHQFVVAGKPKTQLEVSTAVIHFGKMSILEQEPVDFR